jgi:hypothetical protein
MKNFLTDLKTICLHWRDLSKVLRKEIRILSSERRMVTYLEKYYKTHQLLSDRKPNPTLLQKYKDYCENRRSTK